MNKKVSKGIKLTKKQRLFLSEYFKTGNGTQSALKAYDTDDYTSASVIATENLVKLREPIKTYMESKGISLGKLVQVLDDGLNANRVISAVNTDKQATGATADFIDVPDHAVRHKYLETAGKWLKIEPTNQNLTQVNVGEMNLNILDQDGRTIE